MKSDRLLVIPLLACLASPVLGNPIILGPEERVAAEPDETVQLLAGAAILLAGMFVVGHLGSRLGFRRVRLALTWLPLGFVDLSILFGGAVMSIFSGNSWFDGFLKGILIVAFLVVPLWALILALLSRWTFFRPSVEPRLTFEEIMSMSVFGNGALVSLVLAFLALSAPETQVFRG
jgi:hypothetical protein